jgi:uncharacterized membrane protein
MPTTATVLEAVFNPENWEFIIAYACVGGFFAGLVFACMMVSIPMILDRDTDAITACITSMRVFVEHTGVAVFWGVLISVLVVLAMLPSAAGLLVVGPWLGFRWIREACVTDPYQLSFFRTTTRPIGAMCRDGDWWRHTALRLRLG